MKMSRLILVLLIPLALLAAGDENKEPAPKSGPAKRLTLPADAVRIEPGSYRHKDKDGKVWIYRETPFGVVRYEEEAKKKEVPARGSKSGTVIQAFDEGDSVRFERPGPFGPYKWTRKKPELTAEEKQAWEKAKKEKADNSKQE